MGINISVRDLADRLDLAKHPRSWRGRCPACDYQGNVFSVREQRGSRRPLLYCANGCSREELDGAIARVIGGWQAAPQHDDDPQAKAERRAAKQTAALKLWAGSERTGHEQYLIARGLSSLVKSPALRFRADCYHPEGGRLPAMVALVQNVDGHHVAVHRTFLSRRHDAKANVEPAKASLGPVWGGAVRLHDVADELVIGEGIETSASAGILIGLPAWSATSAGNLAQGLMLPAQVDSVVIAADPDREGERAAVAAALRWRSEGRMVRIARPDGNGDFNDLLMNRGHA